MTQKAMCREREAGSKFMSVYRSSKGNEARPQAGVTRDAFWDRRWLVPLLSCLCVLPERDVQREGRSHSSSSSRSNSSSKGSRQVKRHL